MMALKIAILAVMISSSTIPLNNGNINKVVDITPVHKNAITLDIKKQPAANVVQAINKDRTYEQCAREALECIYEEVNKMLDDVVDRCNERF